MSSSFNLAKTETLWVANALIKIQLVNQGEEYVMEWGSGGSESSLEIHHPLDGGEMQHRRQGKKEAKDNKFSSSAQLQRATR